MDYEKLHQLAECRNDSHYKNHGKEGDNLG